MNLTKARTDPIRSCFFLVSTILRFAARMDREVAIVAAPLTSKNGRKCHE